MSEQARWRSASATWLRREDDPVIVEQSVSGAPCDAGYAARVGWGRAGESDQREVLKQFTWQRAAHQATGRELRRSTLSGTDSVTSLPTKRPTFFLFQPKHSHFSKALTGRGRTMLTAVPGSSPSDRQADSRAVKRMRRRGARRPNDRLSGPFEMHQTSKSRSCCPCPWTAAFSGCACSAAVAASGARAVTARCLRARAEALVPRHTLFSAQHPISCTPSTSR